MSQIGSKGLMWSLIWSNKDELQLVHGNYEFFHVHAKESFHNTNVWYPHGSSGNGCASLQISQTPQSKFKGSNVLASRSNSARGSATSLDGFFNTTGTDHTVLPQWYLILDFILVKSWRCSRVHARNNPHNSTTINVTCAINAFHGKSLAQLIRKDHWLGQDPWVEVSSHRNILHHHVVGIPVALKKSKHVASS